VESGKWKVEQASLVTPLVPLLENKNL